MELRYEEYGFYRIDRDYLEYLHNIDDQVFFSDEDGYDKKPHLGLLVGINDYIYCIPLTSAKRRHLNWQNITEHNYLIYEIVDADELHSDDVYKRISNDPLKYKKILAVLEIRKMIPVNNNVIQKIIFGDIEDINYKNLLSKEHRFLKDYRRQILEKADILYTKQKETGIIKNCYVTFDLLENAYNDRFKDDIK